MWRGAIMMLRRGSRAVLFSILMVTAAVGCRKKDEAQQIGETVGEAMSSLDESVAGDSTAMLPLHGVPDELRGPLWRRALDNVVPSAYAASCWQTAFSACAAGVRRRDFSDCTVGGATVAGSATLTFTNPLCLVATEGDAVTRTADITLTGLYGGTLEITSPGGGQTLTRTAGGFNYS